MPCDALVTVKMYAPIFATNALFTSMRNPDTKVRPIPLVVTPRLRAFHATLHCHEEPLLATSVFLREFLMTWMDAHPPAGIKVPIQATPTTA